MSTIVVDRLFLTDIFNGANEFIRGILTVVVEAQQDTEGRVYGDIAISPRERILKIEDMANRGVMDELARIAPSWAEEFWRGYRADIKQERARVGA